MSAPRKSLKERIGLAQPEEPPVVITAIDPAPDKAREGIMAVDRLVKERNEYKARADRLALQNENLINANANERARADHRQRERDHTLRSNAELRAYAYQVCDIVLHMRNILDQNADLVERMPLEPKITNNPSPPVVIDNYAQFDEQGIPYNSAAPLAPSPEELKHVIERLGGNGGVQ